MLLRVRRTLALAFAAFGILGTAAAAQAAGPPPPTATNGSAVQVVATGLGTPTSFAFGDGQVFEGDGGNAQSGAPNGGVFWLHGGSATLLAGSPQFVSGLVWHEGTLYVAGGFYTGATSATFRLLAWSGWNGTTFTEHKVIYTAPPAFQGFNGLAFGPDGRLYVGVDVGLLSGNDHGRDSLSPFLYDILSIKPNGSDLSVFARGMRQPWQLVFPKGSDSPLVSDLGQDSGAKDPLDFILRVHRGDNYGFPACIWTLTSSCHRFAQPFKTFAPHTDVGGLAIVGDRLYMTEFGFTPQHPPAVVSMPLKGGAVTTVVTGFSAPVIGLGAHERWLYFGDLTGTVYRVKV
jgi:glucose/arabinose dehydrogenase